MAKESGLGDLFFVDGVDLSGDVGAVQKIAASTELLDVTAISKSAHERLSGLFDGEIGFNSYFNDAAGAALATLKAKSSGADRICSWFHGSGIGEAGASIVAKQLNYDGTRADDGMLSFDAQCMGNGYGVDYGEQLTAGKRTDTGATNGASLNAGAASALGLVAYLHVFSFTGTDATVKVEQSSDDGAGDAFAAILTFTAVTTAPTFERKVTATLTTAAEQYLRVATSTTGGFSSLVFAVMASRYPYAL